MSLRSPRGEMDIIQVSGTWGLGSIPGEGALWPIRNKHEQI